MADEPPVAAVGEEFMVPPAPHIEATAAPSTPPGASGTTASERARTPRAVRLRRLNQCCVELVRRVRSSFEKERDKERISHGLTRVVDRLHTATGLSFTVLTQASDKEGGQGRRRSLSTYPCVTDEDTRDRARIATTDECTAKREAIADLVTGKKPVTLDSILMQLGDSWPMSRTTLYNTLPSIGFTFVEHISERQYYKRLHEDEVNVKRRVRYLSI